MVLTPGWFCDPPATASSLITDQNMAMPKSETLGQLGEVNFIFLKGERTLIAGRIAGRRGHFMPPSLLESQFAALEEPSPDEHAWVCDVNESPEDLVAALVARASA